ncbi:single-stranded-DNA-specific exonuclease RecJ [filamentous cyanobacterium LEGE 11480]|uniref:Single-stranded-DNA-specific exonuclease RecJ n=2 Tax=Romeriopsis TaxID=2992131 RepID=A0A928Z1W2_9CYAN|nr:single-stranded-DNA-specific exonuclease RecJ [Romeriopsis navalis LEGE 11480]
MRVQLESRCNMAASKIPQQRWYIHPPQPEAARQLAAHTGLAAVLTQVMLNRGISTIEQATFFLDPDAAPLSDPLVDFPDLQASVDILVNAIANGEKIAICGDYDADGMTSTALLMRALKFLGAKVDYAIPSRMSEGYGINTRIIEEFHAEGVEIILTVDNGIAAHAPVARARELGLTVIITDHHEVPPEIPNANAILNPQLIDPGSPYRAMAGVGVAYLLALSVAQVLGKEAALKDPLLELFTLGTIADLAALTGVNRRWVRRGLRLLAQSKIKGIQSLIQVSGLGGEKNIKPEAIGFRLGPRINAVGRIGDPQIVIEMLITEDEGIALERAMQCESINKQRQQLCEQIAIDAVEVYEQGTLDAQKSRVLVIVQPEWHHGVIGIVASRLVERYGVPVFIGTYEDAAKTHVRGSARSIPEFNVFEALEYAKDFTIKHGGHKAAGGFSLAASDLTSFSDRLSEFAHQCLEPKHLKPLVTVDAQLDLNEVGMDLFQQIDQLHPCGMANPDPVFWTPNVKVSRQKLIGKNHLKLTVQQNDWNESGEASKTVDALAWRWGEYYPMPRNLDIAYKLRSNEWRGEVSIELEIVGVRPASEANGVAFSLGDQQYTCNLIQRSQIQELQIRNPQGEVLIIQKGQRMGTLSKLLQQPMEIDVTEAPYYDLVKTAAQVWAKEKT